MDASSSFDRVRLTRYIATFFRKKWRKKLRLTKNLLKMSDRSLKELNSSRQAGIQTTIPSRPIKRDGRERSAIF
jgi:hypothetical protein